MQDLTGELQRLQSRVDELLLVAEQNKEQSQENGERAEESKSAHTSSEVERVKHDVGRKGIRSARFRWVQSAYYSTRLAERALTLGCCTSQLTKCVVMENSGKRGSKYYCVVLQYIRKLDHGRLLKAVNANGGDKCDACLKGAEQGSAVMGFAHNAMSPFGMKTQVPIILDAAILELGKGGTSSREASFIWMGSGDRHLKLGCAVSEFIQALAPIVADVSDPRSEAELAGL